MLWETICRLLSLVGPVFTRVDDSLTPQEPPSAPSPAVQEQRPVTGEDSSREAGRVRCIRPPPLPPPARSRARCRGLWEKGWGASSDGVHRGQSPRAERKGAGLEGGRAPGAQDVESVREQAALLFCELIPSPTSGFSIRAPGTSPRDIRDLGHGTVCARNTLVQKELGKQEESFHVIGVAVLEASVCQG